MAVIGILIKNFRVGGAQKQSIILGNVLQTNHKILIIVFNGNILNERFLTLAQSYGLNMIILKGSLLSRFRGFYRVCRTNHIQLLFSYLAGDNLIAGTFGRFAGVKHVIGGIRNSEIQPLKLIIQRFAANHLFTFTVFNNKTGMTALIKKGFREEKCILIENAIYVDRKPMTRPVKNEIKIITVARFEDQKDHFTALKSIHYLINNHLVSPELVIKYIIIGKGSLQNTIEKWITSLGLEQTVSILIEPPNLENYLVEADIYLSTSLFEGISNSIMEAMLYSLPVVATDVGDNFRLVESGRNGFLVPAGDFTCIAEKLATLTNNHEEREIFGLNSFSMLEERFSVEKFAQTYQSLIASVTHASISNT